MRDGKFYFDKKVSNLIECQNELINYNFEQFKLKNICTNTSQLKISWQCESSNSKSVPLKDKSFNCSEYAGMQNAEMLMGAVSYSTYLSVPKNLVPDIAMNIGMDDCVEVEHQNEITEITEKNEVKGLIVNFEDEKELGDVLEKIIPDADIYLVSQAIDSINKDRFRVVFFNDNSIADLGEGGNSDDLGKTHGMALTFIKNLKGSGYQLKIEYETNLFTNFKNPEKPGFWQDEQGGWHVDQYFIEENIGKVLIAKKKKGDAFYWSIGGGVHSLNKSDGDGALGVFSALGSQVAFHKAASDIKPGAARLYNNFGQKGDETEVFIEGNAGKRMTLNSNPQNRIYLQSEVESRVTGVNDASFVGADISLKNDQEIFNSSNMRFGVGVKSKVYIDGSLQTAGYVDISVGNDNYRAGFKYEMERNDLPGYQNALPMEFANRKSFAPPNENIWSLYFSYDWE